MRWDFATVASLVVFAGTYVLISLRAIRFVNLDRPSAALLGAVLTVACGALGPDAAWGAVNYPTILLLLGMMVVIAHLKLAGFFEWVAAWVLRRARTPRRLLWLLVFASGGLSALFVNDTICLLFTPVVLAAVVRAGLPPAPYLLALATSANVGSVMTLTGNPQNMLVGVFSGIPYGRFLLLLAPVAAAALALDAWILERLYRGRLGETFTLADGPEAKLDARVMRRMAVVVALVFAGFLLPGLAGGRNLPFAAMAGAVLAIAFNRYPPREAMRQVDWPLLLFFGCLFVVVEGVNATGILGAMHRVVEPLFGRTETSQAAVLTGFTVVMSNVVSNVPFVLVARGWVEGFGDQELLWLVVAMASTFAGNLTIVGSVANMIVFEQAKDVAPIGFREHFRTGLPVTLATTAVGLAMLLSMRALGWV